MKILLVCLFIIASSKAIAQVACGDQPQDVPTEVQQQLKGDVEGKAQLFTKLLGDVALKGKVESSKQEVYEKHQNLDKSQIDRYMIWISCQNIMSDHLLTTAQKQQLWLQIYRELKVAPGPQGEVVPSGPHSIVTQHIGLQFRQQGRVLPIRLITISETSEAFVEMRREAFEVLISERIWRTSNDDYPALMVTVSDKDIFKLAKFDGPPDDWRFFQPGAGMADTDHGTGSLYAVTDVSEDIFGANYIVGSRFNVEEDKRRGFYVASIVDDEGRDLMQTALSIYMVAHLDPNETAEQAEDPNVDPRQIDPFNVDLVKINFID